MLTDALRIFSAFIESVHKRLFSDNFTIVDETTWPTLSRFASESGLSLYGIKPDTFDNPRSTT